jgi:hypothetical protein
MSVEAMRLSLEALKNTTPTGFNMESDKKFYAAIKALEEALKQGQGEPVAWMYDWTTSEGDFIQNWTTSEAETLRDTEPTIISNVRPLYLHLNNQQQRKPLTDEQIVDTFCKAPHQNQHIAWFAAGVRYAEAAHGIKEQI